MSHPKNKSFVKLPALAVNNTGVRMITQPTKTFYLVIKGSGDSGFVRFGLLKAMRAALLLRSLVRESICTYEEFAMEFDESNAGTVTLLC